MQDLKAIANRIRRRDLQAVFEAGAGHIGGEMSAIDILTALYFHVLDVDPTAPKKPDRDRFVLSKGHTANALYVTLAEAGFIPKEEVATFLKPYSRLNGHPNCTKVPGVETNTGPLGHGLPVAVGMAKAAQMSGASWRTFVLTGDGEMQEGSNWEAAMAAAHFKLDNLTLIIDHNRLQQGARLADTNNLAPIAPRFAAFGWAVDEIDGNDMDAIVAALAPEARFAGRPKCVVAHTNKGQGISFMRDRVEWHHKVPNREQYEQAMKELEAAAR
ncbi:transketolase [Rhodobium gokarnense]|uniref:Transketolase n=1 Tax=Rhodobium gokarnense TaxID=364296 RepID=A0ABT3H7G1_9HYPH|nr:transketolase [Rhodobium gokarnense]MCW2306323.1 transketolase [Rhodobium gokarnense]